MNKKLTFMLLSSICFIFYPAAVNAAEPTITAGTTIKTRVAEPIESRVRKAGYTFKMLIDSDITKEGKVIIKSGSKAQAVITQISKSGKGVDAPTIIIKLKSISINNRPVKIDSFQVAGKGESKERKTAGEIDEYENLVINQQGEKMTATIPVITKGNDLTLNGGTVVYFILKESIYL